MLNVYSPSKGNAVFKTGLPSLYRLSTGIAVLKTGMKILYRLSTIFKMCLGTSTAFKRFCSGQNWLEEQLQPFN